jgi:tetratricopeptide (TPR) repeat protein
MPTDWPTSLTLVYAYRYTTALAYASVDDNERCAIRLNRAMAYLKCEYYEHALADASSIPADGKQPEKGLYRAGTALYKLGRFDECQRRLEGLLAEYPDNKPGQELLARVQRRIHEQQSGDFDFNAMYEQVNRGQRELDFATYIGPIAIKEAGQRGRGLFTTEAVKAGQLLLCEKPFVYCPPAIESTTSAAHLNVIAIPSEFKGLLGAEGEIVTLALQKSFRNPSAAVDTTKLYCGTYKPSTVEGLVDEQPVVDL